MFFRNFSLTIACFLLLACTPADWQVVRGATESGPPEDIVIDTTVQRVYNCGSGGGTIHLTTQRSLSIGESVHWEIGVELEGGIGLPELGAELQAVYGAGYETSAETGLGWQLSAQPGEWIEYTISWREVWQRGDILLQSGGRQLPVYYRLRKAIRSEIEEKKPLPCEDAADAPAPATDFQLTIRGYGFPPESMTNPAQRRQAALLAAQMDAKRNLAVWLAGEEIDAVTIVENNQVASDEIRREVSAWLVGVRILSEEYDEASGQATVEIAPTLRE